MQFVLSVPMLHAEPSDVGILIKGAVWEYIGVKPDATEVKKAGDVMFDVPIERALDNPLPHDELLSLIRSKIDSQAIEAELSQGA